MQLISRHLPYPLPMLAEVGKNMHHLVMIQVLLHRQVSHLWNTSQNHHPRGLVSATHFEAATYRLAVVAADGGVDALGVGIEGNAHATV